MKIEKYTRELVDGAYRVIDGSPLYDNFEELIGLAKVANDDSENFAENYAEIIRENRLDLYLGGIFLNFAILCMMNKSAALLP